jgi:hypothetical protein
MEVKIYCSCGSKYKFDVEPLNGRLPGPVSCPVCGADGTQKGNEVIAQSLAGSSSGAVAAATAAPSIALPGGSEAGPRIAIPSMSKPAVPIVISSPATQSAGAAVSVAATNGTSSAEVPRSSKAGFVAPSVPRSSKEVAAAPVAAPIPVPIPANSAPQPAVQVSAAPVATVRAVTPAAVSATRLSVSGIHTAAHTAAPEPGAVAIPSAPSIPSHATKPEKLPSEPSFVRGLVGIGAASFVGLLVWFGVTSFIFGYILKFLGIGIGVMIGWTGAFFGQHKSQKLGIAAAVATAFTLLIGTLWAARAESLREADETLKEMYNEKLTYAQSAVKAKTDAEILAVMGEAPEDGSGSDDVDANIAKAAARAKLSDAQKIAEWKRKELPELRKFAEGKVSRLQFERNQRPLLEGVFGIVSLVKRIVRPSMLIALAVAIGAAFKISSGSTSS